MNRICLYCIVVLFFLSCHSERREFIRVVQEWQGKEVIFPDTINWSIPGTDSITQLPETGYKILNYIDSAGCMECRAHFYEWHLMKQQTDSLDLDVVYLVVANMADYRALETLQRTNRWCVSTFQDKAMVMDSLNHFPKQDGLQSFLLDSLNRVVLIGNPVRSHAVRDLYIESIQQGVTGEMKDMENN